MWLADHAGQGGPSFLLTERRAGEQRGAKPVLPHRTLVLLIRKKRCLATFLFVQGHRAGFPSFLAFLFSQGSSLPALLKIDVQERQKSTAPRNFQRSKHTRWVASGSGRRKGGVGRRKYWCRQQRMQIRSVPAQVHFLNNEKQLGRKQNEVWRERD